MIATTYKRPRFRGIRGLGDGALVATPSYANCDPRDTACVNANEVLNTQYNLAVQAAQANNNYTQCLANAANAVGTAQIQATLDACNGQFVTQAPAGATPSSQPSASSGPSFSFTTSNGSMNMNVGDSWYLSIRSIPGYPVTLTGRHSGSAGASSFNQQAMGMTDGNGNFTLSGVVGASDVGNWVETWQVADGTVGSVSFTVNPVPMVATTTVPTVTTTTIPPSQAGASTIVTPPTNTTTAVNVPTASTVFDLFGDTSTPISIGSFQIGEYTAIGLAAVVVVGLMMMGGKKGRY